MESVREIQLVRFQSQQRPACISVSLMGAPSDRCLKSTHFSVRLDGIQKLILLSVIFNFEWKVCVR